ncbi:MAG TPA: STAS domain-containing protein [Actinomycetota bacterium]|nr:STAS domain-containing protein [Actinomycetota bacterium]
MNIRGVEAVGGAFVIEFAGHRSYRLLGDLSGPNVSLFNEIIGPAANEDGDVILKVADLEVLDSSGSRAIQDVASKLAGRGLLRVERPSERVAVVLDLMGAEDDGVMIILPDEQLTVPPPPPAPAQA